MRYNSSMLFVSNSDELNWTYFYCTNYNWDEAQVQQLRPPSPWWIEGGIELNFCVDDKICTERTVVFQPKTKVLIMFF